MADDTLRQPTWDKRPPGDAATRDGWHWIGPLGGGAPAQWIAPEGMWRLFYSGPVEPEALPDYWRYLGPCNPPKEALAT